MFDGQVKDGVVGGVDCQQLDKFEDFVREMVKEGRISSMVRSYALNASWHSPTLPSVQPATVWT